MLLLGEYIITGKARILSVNFQRYLYHYLAMSERKKSGCLLGDHVSVLLEKIFMLIMSSETVDLIVNIFFIG